jgi:hypothetical protein
MTCPSCKSDIPPAALACPTCTQRRSRAVIFAYQRQVLPAVLRGDSEMRLARLGRGPTHLELFGDSNHAFCGVELDEQSKRSRRPHWDLDGICPKCSAVFEQLTEPEEEERPCYCRRSGDFEDVHGCPAHDPRLSEVG